MSLDLIDRLPDLERQADEFERKAHALRQIIEGVRALNGEAARFFPPAAQPPNGIAPKAASRNQYSADGKPRGREAIRAIVANRPNNRTWRVAEIKREIQLRGWPTSPAGIDNALKRLVTSGEAKRIRSGVYRFRAPGADEAASLTNLHREEAEAA